MNNENQYLVLFSCCIPVKGHVQGVIMDIQRNKYFNVPNDVIDVAIQLNQVSFIEVEELYSSDEETFHEYVDFLLKNELVFWASQPSDFPVISKKPWFLSPITNAIVEIRDLDILSYNVPYQLSNLNCQWVEIRYLRHDFVYLYECIKQFQNTRIRAIEIVIQSPCTDKQLVDILNLSARITKITIFDAGKSHLEKKLGVDIVSLKNKYEGSLHCGHVSKAEFAVNLPMYLDSLNGNSCLANKISIDHNGQIKNCPSMRTSYGSIADTELKDALKKEEFTKYWPISKDDIKVCNVCEFRYICTDCRAFTENPADEFSKPLKCGYNPYTGIWSDWVTDEAKRNIFQTYKEMTI